jgi:hypothetical protein
MAAFRGAPTARLIPAGAANDPAAEFQQHAVFSPRKKPPEGGFNSNLMIEDQAAINADFDFRR